MTGETVLEAIMFDTKLTDSAERTQNLPGRIRPFRELAVHMMYRCQAFTVTLSSLGQILFALGCLLVVSLARNLNQAIRGQIISLR